METNCNAYLDPEEDEIFFYEINERETKLKDIFGDEPTLLDMTSLKSYDGLEKDNGSEDETENSKEERTNLLNTAINFEESLELSDCGLAALHDLRITSAVKNEEKQNTEFSKVQISSENKNIDQNHETSNSKINLGFDNHYTTPSKNCFDRNILKTPKSIVKADKDGGFLKVLSEIALVKAEADENLYKDIQKLEIQDLRENTYFQDIKQDIFDQNTKQNLFNDENKENRNFDDKSDIPLIKLIEATPIKSCQSPVNAKINSENDNKKSKSSETLNNYDSEFSSNDNLQSCVNCIEKKSLENENNSDNISLNTTLKDFSDETYQTAVTALDEGNSQEHIEFELIFDKEDNDCSVNDKSSDNLIMKTLPEDFNSVHLNDLNAKLSVKDDKTKETKEINGESSILRPKSNENVCFTETKLLDLDLNDKEKICPDVSSEVNDDLDSKCLKNQNFLAFEDEESKKNWLRRNTKRLWEELNEAAYCEKNEKELNGPKLSFRLSEEARKVIEVIKAVGVDDSITSPDQFFDLDKINNSFLNNDKSDVFNETLTKPLNCFTKKDFELLQEKITSNIFDSFKSDLNIKGKQTLLYGKMTENMKFNQELPKDTPQKIQLNENTNFKKLKNLVTPKQYISSGKQKSNTKQNVKNINDLSGNKSTLKTKNQATYICQSRMRGCQTSEKNVKLGSSTKIPKLASTTSKIPVSGRTGITETGKRTQKINTLSKVQKSLKFNNIESPVQAYINSKTPVLISNIKPKSESGFNVWMKHVDNNLKPMKTDKMTNKNPISKPITSDLPFVEFRSAIPLVVEKPAKSRLPRLAPTMKKLVGSNSPVIAKHKGRIQLNIGEKSQKCENGSSVKSKLTEVSVLYSKVAQVTNVKN